MSCCTTEKKENSTSEIKELEKHFDEVVVEAKETHYCLTLRDKANKANHDYIIWLQVMVAYSNTNTCSHTSEHKLSGACKAILDWVSLLKKPESDCKPKQLSLFGEPDEDELESEPKYPVGEDEGSHAKYYRDLEKVRKSNLMKQYSFFELFDSQGSWWIYKDMTEQEKLLPKDNKAMIELVKDAIVKGTSSKEGHGRFDDYWWDDSHNYICRDGTLSDLELIARVKQLIRLYLVPYQRASHVSYDMSYTTWNIEASTQYHYWFDGKKINGSSWVPTSHLPEYDLNDKDFILWLREHFNMKHAEAISDEDILKENLKGFFQRLTKSSEEINLELLLQPMKDWKEMKAEIESKKPKGHNGSGGGYSIDGFKAECSIDKKGNIKIVQDVEVRKSLMRSNDGLKVDIYRESNIVVYDVSGDDIYKEAFRLFGKKTAIQTTIFDFMAA